MPIYEYACTGCGHRFEKKQSFNDQPLAECPECAAQVQRVLHPAGIIFKGSGWYITDSRASSGVAGAGENGSAAKSESGATPPGPAATDGKGTKTPAPSAAKSDE